MELQIGYRVLDKTNLLKPIETTNLNESVYRVLRQWITANLNPGQRLNLTELETHLQVSRTPIKMALKQLELEGFVEIQARRGTFVAPIDLDMLDGNFKIRSSFELYVALCIFKYLTDEDYAFFDDIRFQMNQLVVSANSNWQSIIVDYLDLDQQLHERLVQCGGPERMMQLYTQTNIHTQMTRIVPHYELHEFQSMHREHLEILASIFDQSPETLSASLLNHLESARHRALNHMSELKAFD